MIAQACMWMYFREVQAQKATAGAILSDLPICSTQTYFTWTFPWHLPRSNAQQSHHCTVVQNAAEACRLAGLSSLGPGDQIALSHWLCHAGTAVTSVCISPAAQLVAVGLGSGEVALYRLWGGPGTEPLRTISLREWGYEPEMTGSVAELQWSPDSRALAVCSSFADSVISRMNFKQCLKVWKP